MSVDRSLKTKGSLVRHRNVLTRAERVAKLVDDEKFDITNDSPTGLPKVAHRKAPVGGGKKKKGPEEGDEKDAKKK
ncbi:MAG TPA: small basic protein [Phycisphaerae bacterium]|nr:small basic protein [Phycisphaerae bacterium]HRW55119.1 small basic protein [Phycisphaerae bacterium]